MHISASTPTSIILYFYL